MKQNTKLGVFQTYHGNSEQNEEDTNRQEIPTKICKIRKSHEIVNFASPKGPWKEIHGNSINL